MQLREEGIGPGYNLCLLLGTSCALGELDNCWTAETFPMPCIRTQNIIKFLKMPRLCYINLQFPLKNCMGARVFFCSPFLLTTNTPNHTQELHGHSKTSPRPQFSAICKLGPFWLAQTNLISRKELTGAVLSLWRISLGRENEPGTDGLSHIPSGKFLTVCQQRAWLRKTVLAQQGALQDLTDLLLSIPVGGLILSMSWCRFNFSERYMLYFTWLSSMWSGEDRNRHLSTFIFNFCSFHCVLNSLLTSSRNLFPRAPSCS